MIVINIRKKTSSKAYWRHSECNMKHQQASYNHRVIGAGGEGGVSNSPIFTLKCEKGFANSQILKWNNGNKMFRWIKLTSLIAQAGSGRNVWNVGWRKMPKIIYSDVGRGRLSLHHWSSHLSLNRSSTSQPFGITALLIPLPPLRPKWRLHVKKNCWSGTRSWGNAKAKIVVLFCSLLWGKLDKKLFTSKDRAKIKRNKSQLLFSFVLFCEGKNLTTNYLQAKIGQR